MNGVKHWIVISTKILHNIAHAVIELQSTFVCAFGAIGLGIFHLFE